MYRRRIATESPLLDGDLGERVPLHLLRSEAEEVTEAGELASEDIPDPRLREFPLEDIVRDPLVIEAEVLLSRLVELVL